MLFDSSQHVGAIPSARSADGGIDSSRDERKAKFAEIAALVTRAQQGDEDAQSELVGRYRRRVAGLVHKMLRRRSLVDDVVQTIMIRMIQRLPRLRHAEVFESWLFRMARNESYDTFRRAQCRPLNTVEHWDWRTIADTRDEQSHVEVREAVEHAIACLNPFDREFIRLVIAGHSYDGIAARTGLTRGAVKIRLYRMRLILRPRMRAALGEIRRDAGLAPSGEAAERSDPASSGVSGLASDRQPRVTSVLNGRGKG